MAPPAYGDIGKSAKDLFSKHYHFGLVKLDFKTKTPTGVEFVVNGESKNDTGSITSSLETKYNIKSHGVTLKQKWNTDNVLISDATVEDYLMRGLKVGLNTTFAPQSGKKKGKLTCGYKSMLMNISNGVDFGDSNLVIHNSGVIGYQGWLAGINMSFDPSMEKLREANFAVGYQAPEFHVTGHLIDGKKVNCSIYQRLNDELESGVNVSWSNETNATQFGLGFHYRIDKDSAIRAKVDSSSQVGVGFIHRLRPGINLTMSAQMDAKSFGQGGHKLGLGFDLEA